jgi:hypothetical protein
MKKKLINRLEFNYNNFCEYMIKKIKKEKKTRFVGFFSYLKRLLNFITKQVLF